MELKIKIRRYLISKTQLYFHIKITYKTKKVVKWHCHDQESAEDLEFSFKFSSKNAAPLNILMESAEVNILMESAEDFKFAQK